MTRVTPDDLFPRELSRIEREIADFKLNQILSGSNITFYVYETLSTWDVTYVMSAYENRTVAVNFVADGVLNAYAELYYDYELTNPNGFEKIEAVSNPAAADDDTLVGWRIYIFNDANAQTLRMKFRIKSSAEPA